MSVDFRTRIYTNYLTFKAATGAHAGGNPAVSRLVANHFPKDTAAAVLDVACGDGTALATMRNAGYTNLQGVDRSPEQVARAHHLGREWVKEGDLFDTLASAQPESIDVILAFDILEHFTKEEAVRLCDDARRALTSRGRLILHTVNAESPFFGRIRYGDITHETAYTQRSLGQMLRAAGFEEITFHENRPIVHNTKSLVRAGIWKLFRTGLDLAMAAETGVWGKTIFSQGFLAVAHR